MPKGQFKRSEAHKRHISEALKKHKKTAEHISKMAEAKRGKPLSEPQREGALKGLAKSRIGRKGIPLSAEHRKKLAEVRIGKCYRLEQYGISPEEYTRQVEIGNGWCSFKKHFVPQGDLSIRKGVCKGCKSEAYRAHDLKRKYGVTLEWYHTVLEGQHGGCAICGTKEPSNGDRHFQIDHNHLTGVVRGILCTPCNMMIERFEKDPEWAQKALWYLASDFPLTNSNGYVQSE